MASFKVSQSKVNKYRQCQRLYFHRYVEKIRSRKKRRPLTFGSIVHKMIEADWEGDDPFEYLASVEKEQGHMFKEEFEEFGNIIDDIHSIMTAYFKYWPEDHLVPLRKRGRCTEHYFELEISDGILLNGYIDAIAKAKGLVWLTEHKTGKPLSEDHRWRNLQTALYIWVIQEVGWVKDVAGVCWNHIRSTSPTTPKINKNGSFSIRSVRTLPTVLDKIAQKSKVVVPRKLHEMGQSGLKYWFSRTFTPVNQAVVDNLVSGLVDTARKMSDNHGKQHEQNIGRHCEWCDYEPLCRAELTGGDVDYLKEKAYTTEDQHDKRKQ